MEQVDQKIAFLGIVVQTTSAVLLALTFCALRRLATDRAYLRAWSGAFLALAFALTAVMLRYKFLPPPAGIGWETPELSRALDQAYQAGKFLFFGWLLFGARRFAGRPRRTHLLLVSCALAAVAVVSGFLVDSLNESMMVQAPLAVAFCGAAAWTLFRAPAARRSFGSRASATVLALFALLWSFYFLAFAGFLNQQPGIPPVMWALAHYNSFIDLLLQMSLGLALVITLFQDLEREAETTRAERAALQARLAESEKLEALGVLVSGVAHELNNPLTSILGFSELIAGDARLPAELDLPARTITEQARRCRQIVRTLLDAARQRPAARAGVRLQELVERVLRGLEPQLADKRLRVDLDFERELPPLVADATGLEQVIANLLVNAIDAVAPGGTIAVAMSALDGGRVELVFEDDGPGIPPALRERIFEPFFTTKEGERGTGLGLAISRRIVQAHGGTIRATERPGAARGARFVIELPREGSTQTMPVAPPAPVVSPAAAPASRAAPAAASGPARARRVLLVDDEAPVRYLLRRWLEADGWQVDEAEDGRAALERLGRSAPPDVLVTDLRMPGMNGIELVARVRERWPSLAARTIVITGDLVHAEVARFVEQRPCVVLEKPIERRRLLVEVAAAAALSAPDRPTPARA